MVLSTNKPIEVTVDGAPVEMPFIVQEGVSYVSLRALVEALHGYVMWNEESKLIDLYTAYNQKMIIDIDRKRILKESLWRNIPIILEEGHTYYPLRQIVNLMGKEVEWDGQGKKIYIFNQLRYDASKSISTKIAFHDLALEGNQVVFSFNGARLFMEIEGQAKDILLLEESEIDGIKEKKYGLFWEVKESRLAHVVLTVRELPDGNRMIYTEGYSPSTVQLKQYVQVQNKNELNRFYWGDIFFYQDRGDMRKLNKFEHVDNEMKVELLAGESFSWFFVQGQEDLTFQQKDQTDAWERSMYKHRSVWWMTPQGTNRGVPEPYLNEWEFGLYFYNLQATTPQLIMDMHKQNPHPLYKAVIDNAAFTLMKTQGEDGFWRTTPNVAYLNRAFGLGENFIDTRMSADASIFLLDYYHLTGNQEALAKAAAFGNYFTLHDNRRQIYHLGEGRIYPDYFAERQRSKPLVSLNHVMHEVNYLLLMADATNNATYAYHANEMLEGVQASKQNWITEDGDLFYALNHNGEYYGEDYIYITYRDLLATKSFLLRHKLNYPSIDELFDQKHQFLKQRLWVHYEANLSFKRVFETFDRIKSEVGSLFLATPLEMKMEDNFAHYAIGAFHWVTGISELQGLGHTVSLDPAQKYFVADLKDNMVIMNSYPSDIRLDENGAIVIENGDQENRVILLTKEAQAVKEIMPGEEYIVRLVLERDYPASHGSTIQKKLGE